MANEIIKPLYSAVTALTITLASLATSTVGVGRQSTIFDNRTTRYKRILLFISIKQGTTPTGNKGVYIFLIRDNFDTTPIRDDGAGATDAAHTVVSLTPIKTIINKAAPSTGDVLSGTVMIEEPGPGFGVTINHDTVAAFDATGSNHVISFIGINDQIV